MVLKGKLDTVCKDRTAPADRDSEQNLVIWNCVGVVLFLVSIAVEDELTIILIWTAAWLVSDPYYSYSRC